MRILEILDQTKAHAIMWGIDLRLFRQLREEYKQTIKNSSNYFHIQN